MLSIVAVLIAMPYVVGLLNGGQFNGRCIIASDRNKSESIKIKELVDTSPELSASHLYPVEPCGAGGPPAHLTHTGGLPVSYEGHALAAPAYSIPVSMASAGGNPGAYSTADHYEGPYSSSQSAGSYGHYGYWGASLPYHGGAAWPNDNGFDAATSDAADGGEYIRTERRKILIQDLPFRARPDQVSTWVRKTMGALASKIKAIEVPQGSLGSEICGYAYVTFRSSSSAKEAVRLLDQGTFKGRQVSVRVASDGVTMIDRPHEATGIDVDRDGNAKKTRRSKHREAAPTSSSSGKKSPPGKDSGSSKSDKSEKTEKDNRPTVPLVVDGRTKRARS